MRPCGAGMGCPVWRSFQAREGRSHGRWAAAHTSLFGAGSNGGATATGPFAVALPHRDPWSVGKQHPRGNPGSRALFQISPVQRWSRTLRHKICLEGPVSDPVWSRPWC